MMERGIIRYRWHPSGIRSFFALACAGFGVLFLWVGLRKKIIPFLIFGGGCLLAAALSGIRREIRIETETPAVILEDRLWGRFRLRHSRWPLSEFTAVTYPRGSGRSNDRDGILVSVGLRRRSRRILRIQYYNNYAEPVSEARRLATKLGLPLEEAPL